MHDKLSHGKHSMLRSPAGLGRAFGRWMSATAKRTWADFKWNRMPSVPRRSLADNSRRPKTRSPESRFAFAWFFLRSKRDARLPIARGAGYQVTEWCECDDNTDVVLHADPETSPRAYRIMEEQGARFPFIGLCVAPLASVEKRGRRPDLSQVRWDIQPHHRVIQTAGPGEAVEGIQAPFISRGNS